MTSHDERRVHGLYFEEFSLGQRIISPGRTVTEADVVAFAGLSGDFNSIHTDAVYAAGSPFGQRVAHGLLGLALASGLAVRTGIMEETVFAFREIKDWKFSNPIFIGDTVKLAIEVEEMKPLPRLGGGSLLLGLELVNQRQERLMHGHWSVLVHSRPSPE
jgi:3-hydroxybutyryl-CoA dehydratase